jgi:hypothetical protein
VKLRNVRTKDNIYVQSLGRSVSGDLGPGVVHGPWVEFWVDKDYVDIDGLPQTRQLSLLIWGSHLGPCEIEPESVADKVAVGLGKNK